MNYYIIPGIKIEKGAIKKVPLTTIASVVCDYFGIEEADFYSGYRKRSLVEARHYFMHFARNKYKYNLLPISRSLKMHHSTVLHGLNVMQDLQFSDNRYRVEITELEMFLNLHAKIY